MGPHTLRKLTVLIVAFAVFGCASSINLKTAQNYEQLAEREKKAGNLKLAEDYYGRALWNANMGKAPVSDISRITYYAQVLDAAGDTDMAVSMRQESGRIRSAHPQMQARFVKDSCTVNCDKAK